MARTSSTSHLLLGFGLTRAAMSPSYVTLALFEAKKEVRPLKASDAAFYVSNSTVALPFWIYTLVTFPYLENSFSSSSLVKLAGNSVSRTVRAAMLSLIYKSDISNARHIQLSHTRFPLYSTKLLYFKHFYIYFNTLLNRAPS